MGKSEAKSEVILSNSIPPILLTTCGTNWKCEHCDGTFIKYSFFNSTDDYIICNKCGVTYGKK